MLKALLGKWLGSWPNFQALPCCCSDCDFICMAGYTKGKQTDLVQIRGMVLLTVSVSQEQSKQVIKALASLGPQEICL